ncbi:hypothetical protein P4S72_07365 [Vibrio sp. PP-XX7]
MMTKTESWANESYVDTQFQKMKSNFVDKGAGVILGEYGAISHLDVSPTMSNIGSTGINTLLNRRFSIIWSLRLGQRWHRR